MKAMGMAVPAFVRGAVEAWDVVRVVDDVLGNPDAFRSALLAEPVRSIDFGEGQVFHGIRLLPPGLEAEVVAACMAAVPDADVRFAFARQSPAGQIEPNDVHSDAMMGSTTALIYLNPDPVEGDGTLFWRHRATGEAFGPWDAQCQADSHDRAAWALWRRVEAHYNRLLLFRSDLFHSRSLVENYGAGDEARLVAVAFLVTRSPEAA